MMSFNPGSRVRLLQPHAGIPAGSVGTVNSGTTVTSAVLFDIDHTRLVVCPNSILATAHSVMAAGLKQNAFAFAVANAAPADDPTKLFWHTPRIRQPHIGTSANVVATTATPNTLSLLLEGAQVALRGKSRSGTWIGSAEFPLTGKTGKLTGQIRGAVEQTKDTTSDVILCVGGLTTRIIFEGETSKEFTEDLSVDMLDGALIQTITLVIICERQPSAGDSLLAVDSIDLVRS
jgi:uncharacterized protein YjbJ (UPF0337 family)